MEGIWK